MATLESYFRPFREQTVGHDQTFLSPFGEQPILYADWTASGRMYRPIEDYIVNTLGPYVANTHTETSITGTVMTDAYHQAREIIKRHVNANEDDCLISCGFGMTAAINKFQRILGIRVHDRFRDQVHVPENERPIVFITHFEHHSNQTSWLESMCDVVIIRPDENGLPDAGHLEALLEQFKDRTEKYGAFSAGSNVTGILTPYHQLAAIMHKHSGYAFIDFAATAPYVSIDMHPENPDEALDMIVFSPHKFLGGPGSAGVLIFNRDLYRTQTPDHPGGGTVKWTNPWGEHAYFDEIEAREDGGTPGFLQTIRTALAIELKEKMGVDNILRREHEMLERLIPQLDEIPGLHVLERKNMNRLAMISLYVVGMHHNLIVKLLNDVYGIQTRGGCSCAGTYGHILLDVDKQTSHRITDQINHGDLTEKPGWVRISLHPTLTDAECDRIADALREIVSNPERFSKLYEFDSHSAEYKHREFTDVRITIDTTFQAIP